MRLVNFVLEKKNMLSSLDRLDYFWMQRVAAGTHDLRMLLRVAPPVSRRPDEAPLYP